MPKNFETFEEFLLRDPLDDFDITKDVRHGLVEKGIVFDGMSWPQTEDIVEKAIKPLRDEIGRLRKIVKGLIEGKL